MFINRGDAEMSEVPIRSLATAQNWFVKYRLPDGSETIVTQSLLRGRQYEVISKPWGP